MSEVVLLNRSRKKAPLLEFLNHIVTLIHLLLFREINHEAGTPSRAFISLAKSSNS